MSGMPETVKRGELDSVPCSKYPVNTFFPAKDGRNAAKPSSSEQAALAICARCPLAARTACLERALARPIGDQWGVIGGTTAAQRKTLLRGRQVASLIGVAA